MIKKKLSFNAQPSNHALLGCKVVLDKFIQANRNILKDNDACDEELSHALEILKTKLRSLENKATEKEETIAVGWEGLLNHYYDVQIKRIDAKGNESTYFKHWLIYPYRFIRANGGLCFLKLDLDSRYDGIQDATQLMYESSDCENAVWEFTEITADEFITKVLKHTTELIDNRLRKEAKREENQWNVTWDNLQKSLDGQ